MHSLSLGVSIITRLGLTRFPLLAHREKVLVEVPKYKMITPSILSDRMRIGGSLARAAIRELAEKGLIRPLVHHSKQLIYTRATIA